ncbi:MAG: DUF4148 domain-containing protein [Stagnimonas sp.]|nr:DUF4148 domain-containing protein [Stagnimonas sp.]
MFIRKMLLSIAVLSAFAAPAFATNDAAFAGERGEAIYSGPFPGQVQQHSTRSRADVQREVQQARQNGSLNYVGDYPRAAAPYTAQAAPNLDRGATPTQMGAARGSDVNADGYRFVGGEMGYIYVGPRGTN